jgi:hypothetical protein
MPRSYFFNHKTYHVNVDAYLIWCKVTHDSLRHFRVVIGKAVEPFLMLDQLEACQPDCGKVGLCVSRFLVYDYCENGSLKELLHGE